MFGNTESSDTRSLRYDATKGRILEAAWRLARENGLAGLSLRDLASEVGMKAPSLYTYFPSKNHIYDAMYAQGLQQMAAEFAKLKPNSDPVQDLRQWTRTFLRLCTEDPTRYQIIFQRPIPSFAPSKESFEIGVRTLAKALKVMNAAGIRGERKIDMWRALLNGLIGMQIANDPGGDKWIRLAEDALELFVAKGGSKNSKSHSIGRRKR
ncbi:MAG: TetR/AcrR family transcriptional regulator [Actinomycetota bacterium]